MFTENLVGFAQSQSPVQSPYESNADLFWLLRLGNLSLCAVLIEDVRDSLARVRCFLV